MFIYERELGLNNRQLTVEQEAFWQPALSMRPHHIFLDDVREAILRYDSPRAIARRRVERFLRTYDTNNPYFVDLFGASGSGRSKYQEGFVKYLDRLSNLVDSSSIILDVAPDGICKLAVIGKHCKDLDLHTGKPIDWCNPIEYEQYDLDHLRTLLTDSGASAGTDYDNLKPVSTTYGDFNGLIAKVGSLRKVLSSLD